MIGENLTALIGFASFVVYCCAAWAVIHAIQTRRTSQSATAWSIALISLPIVAIPLYLVFGRNRFHGYVAAHRNVFAATSPQSRALNRAVLDLAARPTQALRPLFLTVGKLTGMPFATGNTVDLLIDAERVYPAMLEAIGASERYVLVQFYIIRDDETGRQLKDALIACAARGVAVHLLYDEIGCVRLPSRYLRTLEEAGVRVSGFKTTRGPGNRWQINFRNHRKTLVVDGRLAFVGGFNIGDEYLGRDRRLGPWRDTHLKLRGPIVQMAQLAFVEDWYWANGSQPPGLNWAPAAERDDGLAATVASTGPADEHPVCSLLHVEAFNMARRRLWVAAGFFLPDEPIIRALQLAALRGVDVRILLSGRSDSKLAWLASFNYLGGLVRAGVKVFHYRDAVMHQKVFLVDDALASVGSANLDNRSLYVNFEVTALVADRGFAAAVERMLEEDFARSDLFDPDEFARRPYAFRLAVRAANLAAPLL